MIEETLARKPGIRSLNYFDTKLAEIHATLAPDPRSQERGMKFDLDAWEAEEGKPKPH